MPLDCIWSDSSSSYLIGYSVSKLHRSSCVQPWAFGLRDALVTIQDVGALYFGKTHGKMIQVHHVEGDW